MRTERPPLLVAGYIKGAVAVTSTATEVRIKEAMFWQRMAPRLAHFNQTVGSMFAEYVKQATKRRRKSKGYRKHVRRMKAASR